MKNTWERELPENLKWESENTSSFSCLMLLLVVALVGYSVFMLLDSIEEPVPSTAQMRAKVSWYWPPLLGPNCAVVRNGECISRMASGQPWQNWIGKAVACPAEFPFGTIFIIDGRHWICLDRGGAITRINENTIWLDMLSNKPVYKFGTIVDVTVIEK